MRTPGKRGWRAAGNRAGDHEVGAPTPPLASPGSKSKNPRRADQDLSIPKKQPVSHSMSHQISAMQQTYGLMAISP
jgi:hypothetical protein